MIENLLCCRWCDLLSTCPMAVRAPSEGFFFGSIAVGNVVAHEMRQSDDTKSYLPVIAFTDLKSRRHQFTSPAGASSQNPSERAEVQVRYLPSNPKLAYIESFLHMWAGPLALAILGLSGVAVLWFP